MSTDSLIPACKVIFSDYGLAKKIMSDAGCNSISDKFKQFCKKYEHITSYIITVTSPKQWKVEACIKFIKHTKNALKSMKIYI